MQTGKGCEAPARDSPRAFRPHADSAVLSPGPPGRRPRHGYLARCRVGRPRPGILAVLAGFLGWAAWTGGGPAATPPGSRQRWAHQPFDRLEVLPLLAVAEPDREFRGTGAARPVDPVHLGLRLFRKIAAQHVGNAVHWSPRAAMSVAARTAVRFDLKSAKLRCRTDGLLLPCTASARIPA
jgi:hypothetical protein